MSVWELVPFWCTVVVNTTLKILWISVLVVKCILFVFPAPPTPDRQDLRRRSDRSVTSTLSSLLFFPLLPSSSEKIIKRKMQWHEGFREAREPTCSFVKHAFSSIVFIIWELHSYIVQMREILFYKDLQGFWARCRKRCNLRSSGYFNKSSFKRWL